MEQEREHWSDNDDDDDDDDNNERICIAQNKKVLRGVKRDAGGDIYPTPCSVFGCSSYQRLASQSINPRDNIVLIAIAIPVYPWSKTQ